MCNVLVINWRTVECEKGHPSGKKKSSWVHKGAEQFPGPKFQVQI